MTTMNHVIQGDCRTELARIAPVDIAQTVIELRKLADEVLVVGEYMGVIALKLAELVKVLDAEGVLGPQEGQPHPMMLWTVEIGRVKALDDPDGQYVADNCALDVLVSNTFEAETMMLSLIEGGAHSMHGDYADIVPESWRKVGWV